MPPFSDVIRSVMSRFPFRAQPPLIDRGFGLIYDTARNITWLKDTNYARTAGRTPDGQMNWYDATQWVGRLVHFGIAGWRLPSALNSDGSGPCIGENCRDSEIGHLIFIARAQDPNGVQFLNFNPAAKYWNSTEASPTEAYGWDFFGLRQGTVTKDPFDPNAVIPDPVTLTGPILAWPVHDGDASTLILRRLLTAGISDKPYVRP